MGQRRLPGPEDEGSLVAAMRAGDRRAFDLFVEAYVPGLYRFALRRLRQDRELTREVVQATTCKAIEKLDSYRGEAPLFTWLCACCRNEIAGHYRRLDRRPREVELADDGEADGRLRSAVVTSPEVEDRLLEEERAALVHEALDQLPPSYARAMEWRYLEGHGVADIARRLEVTYKATESLLSRARRAFREAYEQRTRASGEEAVAGALPITGSEP